MHIGGCLNRVERRKLIISIENTTPRGSCRREINSSPLNVRHPPSNVSSNLLFYPIVTCLGYRYICAHYARRCHPLKTELNPARATVPTYSRSITLHLDSPGIQWAITFQPTDRWSSPPNDTTYTPHPTLTFRVSISFKHESKRTISKSSDRVSRLVGLLNRRNEGETRERRKERKKKKVVDRRRCHGYEFEFLVNRPVFDSKLCHARALTYAHAHAHGSEASRESKESRVIAPSRGKESEFFLLSTDIYRQWISLIPPVYRTITVLWVIVKR